MVVSKKKILITGVSGALGQMLAQALSTNFDILGVDKRALPSKLANNKAIQQLKIDLKRKSAFNTLRQEDFDAIVHMGVLRNPHKHSSSPKYFNIESMNNLLKLAEQKEIKKFIFLSSANLYGPSPTSGSYINEDAPLHGADSSAAFRDLVELDMMVQTFFWKAPQIETCIFRPAHILGATLNNAPSRYFKLSMMPTMLGYDPMLQAIHATDVIRAIKLALESSTRGIFNLTSGTGAPLSRIIKTLDAVKIPMPELALYQFVKTLFKFNTTHFPEYELDHLKYACLIDDSRSQDILKFRPKYSLLQTINALKSKSIRQLVSKSIF